VAAVFYVPIPLFVITLIGASLGRVLLGVASGSQNS
jgi:hypothetical protein